MNKKTTKTIITILLVMVCLAGIFTPSVVAKETEQTKKDSLNALLKTITNNNNQGISNFNPEIIGYKRINKTEITEFLIKVRVGTGQFDVLQITNFVKEEKPYLSSSSKKAFIMLLGQGLTQVLYREQAINLTKDCSCAVFLFDRRENNIPASENEAGINSIMQKWNGEKYLYDIYTQILVTKLQTSLLNGEKPETIEVIAWGHSLGAKNLDDYDKMDFDKKPFGNIEKSIQVEMIINYDPIYKNLIANQKKSYNETNQTINEGKLFSDAGAKVIFITAMAADPKTANQKSALPGLADYTNLQVFRLINIYTWQFGNAYTPNFHNLDGNLDQLFDVNEQKMMKKILAGGIAPYTPLFEDLSIAGQLGRIPQFQTNSSKVDIDITNINFKGGMDHYGEYSARRTAGKKPGLNIKIFWENIIGHAGIISQENQKVDSFWNMISEIIKT